MRLPPSWQIYDCDEKGGTDSIQVFIAGLPLEAKVEALAFLKLLEEFGNTLIGPRVIHDGDGQFELRGQYVRFRYRVSSGNRINLLPGSKLRGDA